MNLIQSRVMKDSLVDWVGNIPETWSTGPIRSFMSHRVEKNSSYQNTDYLSLMANIGVIPYAEKGDIGNKAPEDLAKCKLVFSGDFVLNSMNFGIGSFGVSAYEGVCSPVYVVMKPDTDKFSSSFLKHVFMMKPFQQHAQSLGNGILEHRAAIGWDELKNLGFPIPPLEEQIAIAEFLDVETAQIDALIEKQQRLIEVLEERSKAVIAKAVTLGLDSKVEIKDSGAERLGKIPKHWIAQTFRRIGQLESGADYKEFEVEEGGYPVIGSGGEFRRVSKFMFEGESVLFGRKGTIDKPLYVNCAFWTVDTMYWTRLNSDVVAKFIYYWATTLPFKQFTTNTALPSMTSSDIKNFEIALPPKHEQLQISNYLDHATGAISALALKAQATIEMLKERRQALISAAVTGKIDVRGRV